LINLDESKLVAIPAARMPPRFVPTLTEVVVPIEPQPSVFAQPEFTPEMQEQLVHRVLQRVDLVLNQRLREALSELVVSHTQSIEPLLRQEIELVVRDAVSAAVAQELHGE
jgi:hypothetical protein